MSNFSEQDLRDIERDRDIPPDEPHERPLEADESLHIAGCTLPGDHDGLCRDEDGEAL